MFEFPVAMGLIPNLSVPVTVFAPDLTVLGAWLAACALGFLAVLPFAMRPEETDPKVQLRRAA